MKQVIIQLWKRGGDLRVWLVAGGILAVLFALTLAVATFAAVVRGIEVAFDPATTPTAALVLQAPASTPQPSSTLSPIDTPSPTDAPPPTDTPGPTDTPAPTDTPGPTNTPWPTNTPAPTKTNQERVAQAIAKVLGDCNRRGVSRVSKVSVDDTSGLVAARFAINDNLFTSLIVFGAKKDIADILRAVDLEAVPYSAIRVEGTFSMKDAYGNVSEEVVVSALYTRETVDKINWSGFLTDNVLKIADSHSAHPDFR